MVGFRREQGAYAPPVISSWGFPTYNADFRQSGSCDDGYQSPQVIVIAPQPASPPPPPPPPPEPPRPAIHDYAWPAPASDAAKVFSLVSKDATVRFAIAVWVQDGVLHYITQDRRAGRAPLDAIDRETTHRLNAEGGLNLWLPPG